MGKKSVAKYLPTLDHWLFVSSGFEKGPPERISSSQEGEGNLLINWKKMAEDPRKKYYVFLLRRLLDCDYKNRATVGEALAIVETLPGGRTGPQPMLPEERALK